MAETNIGPKNSGTERDEMILQQHWIIPALSILGFVGMIAGPIILVISLSLIFPDILTMAGLRPVFLLAGSAYILICLLFLLQTFLDYYLDVWFVTNERIVLSERTSLFSHTTSELYLYQVQDVTAQINGFVRTLFNFGHISVQTAAEKERFVLENIPNPNEVASKILALAHEAHKNLKQ